eukprot:scaffold34306_cov21-Tisochrysis_lutea.AAC.1
MPSRGSLLVCSTPNTPNQITPTQQWPEYPRNHLQAMEQKQTGPAAWSHSQVSQEHGHRGQQEERVCGLSLRAHAVLAQQSFR